MKKAYTFSASGEVYKLRDAIKIGENSRKRVFVFMA